VNLLAIADAATDQGASIAANMGGINWGAIEALATVAAAVIAALGLFAAWWQLRDLASTQRISGLTSILQLEADITARKEKVYDVTEEIQRLDRDCPSFQQESEILKLKLDNRLENWFNAVDRIAFCILKDFVPEKDWRAEYREYIADIVKQHPDFFGAASRFRNIIDVHHKWQRQ